MKIEKQIEKKKAKYNEAMAKYNDMNRLDFSGSWRDRIENNTGPQMTYGNMTNEECRRQYSANVAKKIKAMHAWNKKQLALIDKLRAEIQALEETLRISELKVDGLVEGILSVTPDKRERAFYGAIGSILGKGGLRG